MASRYTLTEDQKAALTQLDEFLASDVNCFLLKGYAGTGKTFLTKGVVRYLNGHKWEVRLMAPTGRAARILSDRTEEKATTIHKGIYNFNVLEEELTVKDGKEKFRFRYGLNTILPNTQSVFIVDEASMVSDKAKETDFFTFGSGRLLHDLMTHIGVQNASRKVKLVFIGDNAQLPPVGDKLSGALSAEYLAAEYGVPVMQCQLREVVRQGGESGILKLAGYLRDQLENPMRNSFRLPDAPSDVHQTDHSKGIETYLSLWREKGPESAILIHDRNKSAFDANQAVRKALHPGQDRIQPGDRLIVTQNNYNHEVELLNGTFVTAVKVHPDGLVRPNIPSHTETGEEVRVTLAYRKVQLSVPTDQGPFPLDCLILETHLEKDDRELSYEEHVASYIDFKIRHPGLLPKTKEFTDALRNDPYFNAVKVKYGYAVTAHKAQGGEWETAIVDMDHTHSMLSDYFLRWTYTAMTRASKTLYLYNVPNASPYSKLNYQALAITDTRRPGTGGMHITLQLSDEDRAFARAHGLEGAPRHLIDRYHSLLAQLRGTGIRIVSRKGHNYQEQYGFEQEGRKAFLTFWYNGKQRFTRTEPTAGAQSDPGLLAKVQEAESDPVAYSLGDAVAVPVREPDERAGPIEFPETHREQERLYLDLSVFLERKGISVAGIDHESYRERYRMVRGEEKATIDLVYDGRNRYTNGQPLTSECDSQALLDDIADCIRQLKND
jgi:tRNA A37 threonylcarbamoyladenosine biosynthesis protein TsaE